MRVLDVGCGKGFLVKELLHLGSAEETFASWGLTAEFHDYPDGWLALFGDAGYTGDYYWTIID
jgi:hypothetical protein